MIQKKQEKKEILSIAVRPNIINEFDSINGYGSRSKRIEDLLIDYNKKNKKGRDSKQTPKQTPEKEIRL